MGNAVKCFRGTRAPPPPPPPSRVKRSLSKLINYLPFIPRAVLVMTLVWCVCVRSPQSLPPLLFTSRQWGEEASFRPGLRRGLNVFVSEKKIDTFRLGNVSINVRVSRIVRIRSINTYANVWMGRPIRNTDDNV